mgnify:CR=1 FL=1
MRIGGHSPPCNFIRHDKGIARPSPPAPLPSVMSNAAFSSVVMSSGAQPQPRHLAADGRRLSFVARPLDFARGDKRGQTSLACLSRSPVSTALGVTRKGRVSRASLPSVMSSGGQAQPRHLAADGRRLSFAARPLDCARGDKQGQAGVTSEAVAWVLDPRVNPSVAHATRGLRTHPTRYMLTRAQAWHRLSIRSISRESRLRQGRGHR